MQLLNTAWSADTKTFFKIFLSALAEPTEVPLTQEVQGEHIDEVRSVVDGEKKNFTRFFTILYRLLSTFNDFTEFRRVSGLLKALEGSQKKARNVRNIKKFGEKQKTR